MATGVLEVFIIVNETKFVIERLGSGTIINHLNFFFDEETWQVEVNCYSRAKLLYLSKSQIEHMMVEEKDFQRQILLTVNQMYKLNKKNNLDIIRTSKHISLRQDLRQRFLKNVVI